MTDIVKKLHQWSQFGYGVEATATMKDAAAEIERLRAGLFDCMQETANHHQENIARAAIGGSDIAKRKAKAIVARSGVLLHNIQCVARAALNDRNLIEKGPTSPPGQSIEGRKT